MWSSQAIEIPRYFIMEQEPSTASAEGSLDHMLMQRIGQGDEEAFAQLIERHQNMVVGTVAKMLGNASEAEDISQQVFLRIWKHARRYKPNAKFTTYLFTITRNLVFNEIRRRNRRKEVSSDERQEVSRKEIADAPQYRPDREMERQELSDLVDKAIARLPEQQRLAVVLRRYEQMPYEDIAEVLDLSLSAVKSLLFRARTSLREALSGHLSE
ncbi:MAG: sigma-70 family RNA polymerase sigma factor [Akkermansiaceae bacterium]|nr:sigma-70 family RNA polymerase sigma factor [Akkermansiaceae bacterium]